MIAGWQLIIPLAFITGWGLNQPVGSPTAKRLAEMAEAIGGETGGEFRLDVFPESRLGPDPQMLADMRSGALEFFVAGATLGGLAPTSALPLLPFAFTDSSAVFAALDGALGERIRGELARNGVHAFRHSLQNGFHHLTTSTRPIHAASDLKGVKIPQPWRRDRPRLFCCVRGRGGVRPVQPDVRRAETAPL